MFVSSELTIQEVNQIHFLQYQTEKSAFKISQCLPKNLLHW